MGKVVKVDVAVMGSGVAGMGAAYKLVQAGVKNIAVFEKYPAQGGAVSNCPMCFCSTPDTPEAQKAAFEVLAQFSNYDANMNLISKVVKYSSEFPRIFLEELNIKAPFVVNRPPEDYGNQRGYTMGHANGLDVGDIYFLEGRGQGHAMALALLRMRIKLEKEGVQFFFRTPIKKILKEGNKVTGAVAFEEDGTQVDIQCKALIVASGGISGNLEMMKEEGVVRVDPKFEEVYTDGYMVMITFPDSCQDGDGQKAVWEIGGQKTPIVISADPAVPGPGVRIGRNTPWFAGEIKIAVEHPYLRVNEQGKRFINEEMSNQHTAMSRAYANQSNMHGYLIFDEDTRKHLAEGVDEGYVYFIFEGAKVEHLVEEMDAAIAKGNKHMCHFPTIHEVADYMGIDEAGLKETIDRYNQAKENGYDPDFHTDPKYIRPVREESGQIYCFRLFAGGYDTMGGLAIDENANVLDINNQPIEGLYAGGDMATGSLYGNPTSNAGGTVFGSMTTGMLAGDSAAAFVKGEF